MTCEEARLLLHPYLDGELELMRSLEIEQHLRDCTACAKMAAELRALRSGIAVADLYYSAPARLEATIGAMGRRGDRQLSQSRRRWPLYGAGLAAAAILLIGLLLGGLIRHQSVTNDVLAREVVTDHIRSLMAGHLTDVLSSNQHTVKPWFEGKLDFSPMVIDLSTQGFPLIGGRLDYLNNHSVAAIVYRHGAHPINLFVWPSPKIRDSRPAAETHNGYNVVHWNENGDAYWAVSSVNAEALNEFVSDIRKTQAAANSSR